MARRPPASRDGGSGKWTAAAAEARRDEAEGRALELARRLALTQAALRDAEHGRATARREREELLAKIDLLQAQLMDAQSPADSAGRARSTGTGPDEDPEAAEMGSSSASHGEEGGDNNYLPLARMAQSLRR